MPLVRSAHRAVCAALALGALTARTMAAQPQTRSATVSVSLRVLPHGSLDGDADRQLSSEVTPGEKLRVEPTSGVRARMTYMAATQVLVTGTPLRGPGGAEVKVRFVCAYGGGTTVSAGEPFDCVNGVLPGLKGAQVAAIPLAIGAELSAAETSGLPPGVYSGRVTLMAIYPDF